MDKMKALVSSVLAAALIVLPACGQMETPGAQPASSLEMTAEENGADISQKPENVTDVEMTTTFADYDENYDPVYMEVRGTYTGLMVNGKPEGEGVFTSENADGTKYTYTGGFKDGKPNGYGSTVWETEDQPSYREDGTYIEGLYAPTTAEMINSLGQTPMAMGEFAISKSAADFIDANETLFPAESEEAAKEFCNSESEIRKIKKSVDGFDSSLIRIDNALVLQTFEGGYAGKTLTYMLLVDENDNYISTYFIGKNKYYEGDQINAVYGLPLANTGFENVAGGTTLCVAMLGSFCA